jgi:hypothetical protein
MINNSCRRTARGMQHYRTKEPVRKWFLLRLQDITSELH